jgi:excisionase family DNA binding protein
MKQNEKDSISDWLNSEEAARFLKIDKPTLMNLVSNGRIPYFKFGRSNRYLRSELENMLRSMPMGERLWESNRMR